MFRCGITWLCMRRGTYPLHWRGHHTSMCLPPSFSSQTVRQSLQHNNQLSNITSTHRVTTTKTVLVQLIVIPSCLLQMTCSLVHISLHYYGSFRLISFNVLDLTEVRAYTPKFCISTAEICCCTHLIYHLHTSIYGPILRTSTKCQIHACSAKANI